MLFLIDERHRHSLVWSSERSAIRTASLDLGSAEGAIRRKAPAGPILELWFDRYPSSEERRPAARRDAARSTTAAC